MSFTRDFEDVEVVIKKENELIDMREHLRRKEEREAYIEYGFRDLKAKIEAVKQESKRAEMIKSIPYNEIGHSTNFFEFQPHMIYLNQSQPKTIPPTLDFS